jgi:hypothetical protein
MASEPQINLGQIGKDHKYELSVSNDGVTITCG